jgi:hypothetical protein
MVYCFLTLQQASIVVPRRKMQANCSWCFESSTHFLDRETAKWICQACLGAGERCMASGCAVRTRTQLLFSLLFVTFNPQGIIRCEVISQGSACVTCAGLWAKTSQTRASVFEHNRDVAGVRFELRSGFCSWLSFSIPSFFGAAALATFAPRHRKRVCCAPFCCLSACLPPCDAF